ncbi:helix-turn-helix transcriptional regulator [Actinomycetota bacterium]
MSRFGALRPLVGRGTELSRLTKAAGIDSGDGGIVVVSGDAGIGKSRLIAELAVGASERGWLVLVGHCVGHVESTLAYLPFIELLGTIDREMPEAIEAVLPSHPALANLLPARPDTISAPTDAGLVAEAVHAALVAVGERQPSLAVIEDVHWADHSSRDLLTLLFTRGFSSPVSLVVTYRSDDLHRRHPLQESLVAWSRLPQVRRLELGPLSDTSMRRFVRSLDESPADRDGVARVVERAEGNPFFAEELVASGDQGPGLSPDLRRLLQLRVEQLDPTAQRVVHAIAAAGRQVSHELLEATLGLPDAELDAALRAALEHHIIKSVPPADYAFRHALMGETLAEDLLPGERLRLHRAYAAVLTERPELGSPADLARHAAATGDIATAIAASTAAGDEALRLGGPLDALQHYERALHWTPEDDPARDDLVLRAAQSATLGGDGMRALGLLREAIDHRPASRPPATQARLLAAAAMEYRLLDLPVRHLDLTTEAVGLLDGADDETRLAVLIAHFQALVDEQEYAAAVATADEALALAESQDDERARSEIRTIMVRVLQARDEVTDVDDHMRGVLAQLRGTDDPIQIRLLHQIGGRAWGAGRLREALDAYNEGMRVAARLDRPWAPWAMECRLYGALVAISLGEWPEALERLAPGEVALRQPGRGLFQAATMLVKVGQGEELDPGVLEEIRAHWHLDGLMVPNAATAAIVAATRRGEVTRAIDLAESAVATLDRIWGEGYQAIIRISAVLVDGLATCWPQADKAQRQSILAISSRLAERAESAASHSDIIGQPSRRPGPETVAWAAYLRAAMLRLRWKSGTDVPKPAAMVSAWEQAVEGFEAYPAPYERACAALRLAGALAASGDARRATEVAQEARAVGVTLGARPLVEAIDALATSPVAAGEVSLTARESEILRLVSEGRTNGQIGTQLFISPKTVSVHVSNILAKLGAATRQEAADLARRQGLLD